MAEPKAPFVEYLERLRDHGQRGRPAMAALRNAAGLDLDDAPQIWTLVVPWCGERGGWYERHRVLVATLFATHQRPNERPPQFSTSDIAAGRTSFGSSLGRLERTIGGSLVSEQFELLLTADRDTIGSYLIVLVEMLRDNAIPVDWSGLLSDLSHWWPEGKVALQWARAYTRHDHDHTGEESDVR